MTSVQSATPTAPNDTTSPGRVVEILAAACRVIARDGAHGLHMNTVAREAGVSKALVHYYFATRQELLRQALAYADERTRINVEAELDALPSGHARLSRMLEAYACNDALFSENHALWNAAWGSLRLDPELAPGLEAGYQRWTAWIRALVTEGREDGSIDPEPDPEMVAIRLTALADGLSTLVDTGVLSSRRARGHMTAALTEIEA